MLNKPYLVLLALVCHTNRILSSPLIPLVRNGDAIRELATPQDIAKTVQITGISDVRYTQDLRVTEDGIRFHKDFPDDANLKLEREVDLPQGREADSEKQPKAVIIGVSSDPSNGGRILLTQRFRNGDQVIALENLKNAEFPRGHGLKDDLETRITYERLAELRKGPLADEEIPQLNTILETSNYILGKLMKKANINLDDKDLIPKLAANREIYEETGQWGKLVDVNVQKTYLETKPAQSTKAKEGGGDINKKQLMPYVVEIPANQEAAFTIESYGRNNIWTKVDQVLSTIGREEMKNMFTDVQSKVVQIAMKNAKTNPQSQVNFIPPPLAIPAN